MFSMDAMIERIAVTLADGVERELNYNTGSLIWLKRFHQIDLMKELTSALPELADKAAAMAEKRAAVATAEEQATIMAESKKRMEFVIDNIDFVTMAGLMDAKGNMPAVGEHLVRNLPPLESMALVTPIFKAVMRDLNRQTTAAAAGTPDPNSKAAA